MKIIFETENFFAIDKPAGYFVHPPEKSCYPVPAEKICLYVLRDQLRQDIFPVHRLDAPTSGVVLFAKSRGQARELNFLFSERKITKNYLAVARGFVEPEGEINIPLEIAGFENTMESKTRYQRLATVELPFPVGKKYPTARYSLVQVQPVTGRWHQIRRHFDRIAHPLLGDIEHGDSHHNRFFRDELKISGLCLKAVSVEFVDPWSLEQTKIQSEDDPKWQTIKSLFSKD